MRRSKTSIRNVAYALLSGADGWMFDGEDALGQVSTMSLDNQRNLKLAIHRDPVFMKVAEQVAGEMNKWAQGFFGRADHRRLEEAARLHDQDLPRARAASRRSPRAPRRAAPASPRPSSTRRSTSSTTTSGCAKPGASLVLYLPKIQTAEEAALWNDILSALEQHLGLAGGHHQGLRARRAGRGVLPADGDPRRARQALRRLQHRPLGLHQQRLGRDGLGSGVRQPEHRRHHDDLRLHAQLRGPRAPRRATRPTSWASSRSGRAAWSPTSRSAPKPASPAA